MKLVIVESPAKSKTIGRYLGDEYQVEASVGHIRDLSTKGKGGLGVDVENGFLANYIVSKDKKTVVKKLESLKNEADEVILATDPDREGEAIAWHLASVLGLDLETTKRLEFHAITKESILEAIENPRTIDMKLVHSQEARRIIDRIIGFKLSNLLYNRIKSKSAGRVQSVTLKLIVDHEKEIKEFVPEEYWTIAANIIKDDKEFVLDLVSVNGKEVKIHNQDECTSILSKVGKTLKVSDIKKTSKKTSSRDALITSTLQQEAFTKYKFKTKETTFLAQKLYEGVETDEGLVGLITYIRTDSTRLAESFVYNAKDLIIKQYGEEYYKGPKALKKTANMQDAHEAIRPTSLARTPELMKKFLTDHEYKLYKLIYNRALGSLMSDKGTETTTISFDSNETKFNLSGSVTTFKGYDILKLDEDEVVNLPSFEVGQEFKIEKLDSEQHFTKAPARYSEGKVVRIMEEKGIGRPSTYASTIQTLISRKYVTSGKEGLIPTEQGIKTVVVLCKYFPDLMNTEYTAEMETNLDNISSGSVEELQVISDFYNPFIEHFDSIKEKIYKDPLEETGEKCPECGSPLVIRHGKNGDFVACSNYPTCKYVKKEEKEPAKEVGRNCPNCGHPLVYRTSKNGEFIGCSNYPKCRYVENANQTEEELNEEKRYCPDCGALLVKRKSKRGYFYGCSNYPKCHHVEAIKKDEN